MKDTYFIFEKTFSTYLKIDKTSKLQLPMRNYVSTYLLTYLKISIFHIRNYYLYNFFFVNYLPYSLAKLTQTYVIETELIECNRKVGSSNLKNECPSTTLFFQSKHMEGPSFLD